MASPSTLSSSTPSSASSPKRRTITFVCADGKSCSMDEAAASQSKKLMSDATLNEIIIEDRIVTGEVMDKFIEYCKIRSEYQQQKTDDDEIEQQQQQQLEKWDQDFTKGFADDHKSVLAVLIVAKWLEIERLTKLTAERVAAAMRKMSIEEIRELFGVVNDFTPEEMEEMKKEESYIFI